MKSNNQKPMEDKEEDNQQTVSINQAYKENIVNNNVNDNDNNNNNNNNVNDNNNTNKTQLDNSNITLFSKPKFRITLEHLLANKNNSKNIGFNLSAEKGFFEVGEGGLNQLKADVGRDVKIMHTVTLGLSHEEFNKLTDNELKHQLEEIIGDKALTESLIQAHSQGSGGFIMYTLSLSLPENSPILISNATHRIININKQADGNLHVEFMAKDLVIRDHDANEIGVLQGTVHASFKLVQKNNQFGFEFEFAETDNQDMAEMLKGVMFDPEYIYKKYCKNSNNDDLNDNMRDDPRCGCTYKCIIQ